MVCSVINVSLRRIFRLNLFIVGLLVFLMCSGGPVYAESDNTLTLEQAIDTAITSHPQIRAAQARLGVSQAEILTAGARLNPSLMSDNGIAEKTYRLGIEQTIELGGKRRRRVAVAQAQREVVLAEINTVILDIRANVRRTYTQLFNLQERQRTAQEIYTIADRLLDVANKREYAGDISHLDVLQAQIASVNARNDVQTLSYEVLQARTRLNALLNRPVATPVNTVPPTPFPQTIPGAPFVQGLPLQGGIIQGVAKLEELIQEALARRPEVQRNLRSLEVTQRQLALAKANRIPNFSLAAGPDYVAEPGQKEFNVFVVGNLEIPLFNRQQGPIAEAMARRIQLEQEQAALKNQITTEVSTAYIAFVANQERIKRYEVEILPKAQEVVEKSQRSFEEGKSSILIPLNAQQAYRSVQLGYVQALLDFQNAISDLERAVGTGL